MAKIYVVAIRWVTTNTDVNMMDGAIGSVGDWFRWNSMTYFVHSNKSSHEIRQAVMARLTTSDSVLVVETRRGFVRDEPRHFEVGRERDH